MYVVCIYVLYVCTCTHVCMLYVFMYCMYVCCMYLCIVCMYASMYVYMYACMSYLYTGSILVMSILTFMHTTYYVTCMHTCIHAYTVHAAYMHRVVLIVTVTTTMTFTTVAYYTYHASPVFIIRETQTFAYMSCLNVATGQEGRCSVCVHTHDILYRYRCIHTHTHTHQSGRQWP
jgi:hypothetical protein